jgi:hypothetical protein
MDKTKPNSFAPLWFAAAFTMIGVIYWFLAYVAYPEGYCTAQQRYISDDEFVGIAVRMASGNMNIDRSDASMRNFHVNHPRCCQISREGTLLIWRVLGTASGITVELKYLTDPKFFEGVSKLYEATYVFDSCGKKVHFEGTDR